MKAYKIKKISIENFKPIDLTTIDFSNKDLIVLDGPNGFGKTTIFDAIELVLLGKISRVVNTTDARYGYNDLLFSKDKTKDTVIKIEFYNGKETFTVVKRFNSNLTLRASERRPDNWGVFETYILQNFDDPLHADNLIDSEEIYTRLNIDNLSRYFSLFYYIQQEENTYFLKKSSKDRMNEVAQLFDTYKEQSELKKLEGLKSELEQEKRRISGSKGLLSEKQRLLKTITTGVEQIDKETIVQEEYLSLLKGFKTSKEWDQEDISVQKQTRDLYLADLRQLYDFVKHFDEFINSQKNKIIQKYTENFKLLEYVVTGSYFYQDYEHIKQLKEKEKKLYSLKKTLIKEEIQNNLDSFSITEIEKLVELDVNLKAIQEKISLLKEYKNSSNELSSIVQELNTTRNSVLQHFEKIHRFNIDSKQKCPLCGHTWKSYEDLVDSIEAKGKLFREYYDSSSKKFETELDDLFEQHLNPINKWIDDYLNNEENIIDQKFYNQLTESYKQKHLVRGFLDWCEKERINLNPYINREKKYITDVKAKNEEVSKFLQEQKLPTKKGYSEFDQRTIEFEMLYQDLFDSKKQLVQSITLPNIVKKVNYINYQYYRRNSKSIIALKTEISQLENRQEQIDLGIEKLKSIIKIYTKYINQHWQTILREIEIPFFIYSGKILQDYQRGLGLFIKESEGDGVKTVKFVSDPKSDHDAINYLSSGQLSALIISFTLALNKVYGNKSMDILLIDDPVQTMDEINMASFVELLRNEFKNKQIFLSTHEIDVSRYIRYKFKKYNLETLRFNVKEKLYVNS